MKNYYEILGVEEDASQEEIEARWAEWMRQYRSELKEEEGPTAGKIKEITEAYQFLRDPAKRKEYDLERFLKRSALKRIQQRREQRYRRRKLFVPGLILLLFLTGTFLAIRIALTPTEKRVALLPPPSEAEKVPSPPESIPVEEEKLSKEEKPIEAKPSLPLLETTPKPKESPPSLSKPSPPLEKPQSKELAPKERISEPIKIEKPSHGEPPREELSKPLRPFLEEPPKVEPPRPPAVVERPLVIASPPLAEVPRKPELPMVNEKEKPKAHPNEILPKEVPTKEATKREALKEVTLPAPKEEPKVVPKELTIPALIESKGLPIEAPKEVSPPQKEEPKAVPKEPPPARPTPTIEEKPRDPDSQRVEKPKQKPAPSIAALPPLPHPFVKENEIRRFLASYIDRYINKDLEGFLSLFSSRALQNQRDGIDQIRKIYSRQFELYERFNYRLVDPKIEILEKTAKVRALYEIDQFSKRGEVKKLRGEIEWDLVKEDGELKVLAIQYRTIK